MYKRQGDNRGHAVLGAGPSCVATHPSDPAVALSALDALLELHGADGVREVPLNSFYRLPGETPQTETVLRPGELITRVTVPPLPGADRSVYVKVRDRRSYEFALVSAAVAVDLHDGKVRGVRIALGGVAPRPWRAHAAEQALTGREFTRANALEAAAAAADGAEPLSGNAFKIELVRRTVGHALTRLGGR